VIDSEARTNGAAVPKCPVREKAIVDGYREASQPVVLGQELQNVRRVFASTERDNALVRLRSTMGDK